MTDIILTGIILTAAKIIALILTMVGIYANITLNFKVSSLTWTFAAIILWLIVLFG